jgi:hypothetical protein
MADWAVNEIAARAMRTLRIATRVMQISSRDRKNTE